ncbi:MAG: MerR family transcriptional regulator [Hyphomicrobiales bacterium]|nr:MerR family transcriptional regulator [Hyphomicrobiales bacterium]
MDQNAQNAPESADRLATIGELARRYRVTLRALRFYEDRGLIKPTRYGTGRFYDAQARARLETILKGKKLGFTLTQIAAMLPQESGPLQLEEQQVARQIAELERKREDLDQAIAELRKTHNAMANRDGASDASLRAAG